MDDLEMAIYVARTKGVTGLTDEMLALILRELLRLRADADGAPECTVVPGELP